MTRGNTRGIMKRHIFTALTLAFIGACGAAADSIVYDNTANDTGSGVVFSAGPYEQIGDLITLGGVDRILTGASVQFYNGGEAGGTFDAILRFWNPGTDPDAPVGSQIGTDYEIDGLTLDAGATVNEPFAIPNLAVPDTLVTTVQILNESPGMDLWLDLYDPPSLGTSDNTSFIYKDTSFHTSPADPGYGNLYLQLDATTLDTTSAPEPPTGTIVGGILVLAGIARRSGRRARARALPLLS
jgi:hypothetical protein